MWDHLEEQEQLLLEDAVKYTAPPVPALKPIQLPDLRQIVSGERYVWSDGIFNYRDDVIEILRAAGCEVATDGESEG